MLALPSNMSLREAEYLDGSSGCFIAEIVEGNQYHRKHRASPEISSECQCGDAGGALIMSPLQWPRRIDSSPRIYRRPGVRPRGKSRLQCPEMAKHEIQSSRIKS